MRYILFLFLFTAGMLAQERFELKGRGFSFEEPAGWIKTENAEMIKNIEKIVLTNSMRNGIDQSSKKFNNFIGFAKYDAKKYSGIIPTINFSVAANPAKNFEQFKQMIVQGQAKYKNVFTDFKSLSPVTEITINAKKALVAKSSYVVTTKAGSFNLVVKSVYISGGADYYTINFVEEIGKENNVAVFDKLIKTIKISDK